MSVKFSLSKTILTAAIMTFTIQYIFNAVSLFAQKPIYLYAYFFLLLAVSGVLSTIILWMFNIRSTNFLADMLVYSLATMIYISLFHIGIVDVILKNSLDPLSLFMNLFAYLLTGLIVAQSILQIVLWRERRKVKNALR